MNFGLIPDRHRYCTYLYYLHRLLRQVLGIWNAICKYSEVEGADSNRTCSDCDSGKCSTEDVAASDTCSICDANTYSAASASICTYCVCKYSEMPAAGTRNAIGKYSEVEGADNNHTCSDCDSGKCSTEDVAASDTCSICDADTYSAAQHRSAPTVPASTRKCQGQDRL